MYNIERLRQQIRQIISEAVMISESQKTPEVDNFIDNYFRNALFFVDGHPLPSEIAKRELRIECPAEVKRIISQMQTGNLQYDNFYVLKLSRFVIVTPSSTINLSFENPTSNENEIFRDTATSFLVYGYHDTLFKVVPYNENFYSEAKVKSSVEQYLKSPEFQNDFSTKTQRAKFTGEIKFFEFDRKIKIYTDYFNIKVQVGSQAQEPTEKTPFAKSKKSYRPNTPLLHKIFGKGIIKATEKVREEPDGIVYNLDVEFPDYGLKKIRMKSAA